LSDHLHQVTVHYIGWSDATVICHYDLCVTWGNMMYYVKLSGEDLSPYNIQIKLNQLV